MAASTTRGRPGAAWAAPLLLAPVVLCGCEFEIPAPSYIHETKLISVRAEVTQLGPLNPDRVGVPFTSPMSEAMPGDRLAFEAVIVEPDGHELGADEVESIWFQCGVGDCGARGLTLDMPEFSRGCDAAGEDGPLTLDDACRVAEGDVRAEFEVGALGPDLVAARVATFYGILAWNGRRAEDCFAARREAKTPLDDCAFIQRSVKIGPSWWLLAYAETLGFESPIPLWQIPAAIYAQAANRTPAVVIEVFAEGELLGSYPEQDAFTVALGDHIDITVEPDELQQLTQVYFYASQDPDSEVYWFQPAIETVLDTAYTTSSIHAVDDDAFVSKRAFVVDEYAEPGSAQIFVLVWDDRFGEDVVRLNFEVVR